jgi:hypothetical protein
MSIVRSGRLSTSGRGRHRMGTGRAAPRDEVQQKREVEQALQIGRPTLPPHQQQTAAAHATQQTQWMMYKWEGAYMSRRSKKSANRVNSKDDDGGRMLLV